MRTYAGPGEFTAPWASICSPKNSTPLTTYIVLIQTSGWDRGGSVFQALRKVS